MEELPLPFSCDSTLGMLLAKGQGGGFSQEPSLFPGALCLLITAATAEPQPLWGPVEAVSSFHFNPTRNKLRKGIS